MFISDLDNGRLPLRLGPLMVLPVPGCLIVVGSRDMSEQGNETLSATLDEAGPFAIYFTRWPGFGLIHWKKVCVSLCRDFRNETSILRRLELK